MMSRRKHQFCHARLRDVALLGLAIVASLAAANLVWGEEGTAPQPDGYRLENYRAPTPSSLEGARTIDTVEAARLWRDKSAVFIDVMPQAPRPANLPAGTIWRDKPRFSIPGSAWLPDTGYGELAAATEAYLKNGLATLAGGDRAKPVVIYCLRDCWMSWNAAKRAVAWGYTNVSWYPDGTDGWQAADLPLEPAQPVPRE
ncbi:MAG: PQQ-dependent catabolism-associated CXXCW motif protein [Xanthobacteraceae bacterium]